MHSWKKLVKPIASFHLSTNDTYQWYLDLGPLSNVNKKYFHNKIPTWNNYVSHPNYDEFLAKTST